MDGLGCEPTPSIAVCAAMNLPFDGTNCGAACTGNTPMLNTVSGMCEAAAATDSDSIASCAARNLPFDATNCGAACSGDTPDLDTVSGMCEAAAATEIEMPENETPATTAARTTDDDDTQTAAFIGGGMVVVGGLVWYLSGGNFALFATTPEFGYSITESGYSANIGGRADFRQDRWHLYWTAGQTNANGEFGDFRYSSGGKWQGDIFAAAFSEKVSGETADYDLSLSANWTGGIWKVSPEFAAHSVYEEGEFATTNSFRINGEMQVDDWRLSASGNKTQMELSAVRGILTEKEEREGGRLRSPFFFANNTIPAKAGISAPQGALFTRKRSRFAR